MIKKKLEWINIKDGYCPSCYRDLNDDGSSPMVTCSSCDFKINRPKFDEILEEIEKREAGDDAENA